MVIGTFCAIAAVQTLRQPLEHWKTELNEIKPGKFDKYFLHISQLQGMRSQTHIVQGL